MTLEELIRDPNASWTRQSPAPPDVVERLAATLPELPPDYLAFLRLSNGGEGECQVGLGWFSLWPAEDVAGLNVAYEVRQFLPGFVAFGSNGGGDMLAFGATKERRGQVFTVPFIPMKASQAVEIAPDFATLVRSFGHVPPVV